MKINFSHEITKVKNFRVFTLLAIMTMTLLSLSGCSTSIRHDDVVSSPGTRLEREQDIYIALSKDGIYSGREYSGSGTQVAHFIAAGVRSNAGKIKLAFTHAPVEKVLAEAKSSGARYAFIPLITNWEPRAAAWSGLPTRVSMTIMIFDIPSETQLLAHKIDITGRTVTLVSQSADELAKTAISQFCDSIF